MVGDESPIVLPSGVSQRQIADAIGVSISTVSRALAGHPRVSARTRAQVVSAIRRLNTGSVGPRKVIGLTHSHVLGPPTQMNLEIILEQVLAGAELMASARGYGLYTLQNAHLMQEAAGTAFLADVQGVVTSGGLVTPSLIESLTGQGLPVVVIGGHVPHLGVPSVGADSFGGMVRATQHLLELGHRRIALVNGPSETYTSTEKKAGYLTALMDAGITPEAALIRWRDGRTGFDMADALSMARALLDLDEPPTAMLFANDAMAHAGLSACRERGLSVPGDVSLVGFHDDPDALLAQPQLTTVRVNRNAWGAAAVQRLLDILEHGDTGTDRRLLPVELVVRGSTARVREGTA